MIYTNQSSNLYGCLHKDQLFVNLEDDIAYFKQRGKLLSWVT